MTTMIVIVVLMIASFTIGAVAGALGLCFFYYISGPPARPLYGDGPEEQY